MEITTNFILAQILSALAGLTLIASVQFKRKSEVLTTMIANNILFVFSYLLLGGYSGMLMCALALGISLLLFFYDQHRQKPPAILIASFFLMMAFVLAITYRSPIDLLPFAASYFWIASLVQHDMQKTRVLLMTNFTGWLIYNIIVGAWTIVPFQVFSLISGVIALHRHKTKPKPKKRRKPRPKARRT